VLSFQPADCSSGKEEVLIGGKHDAGKEPKSCFESHCQCSQRSTIEELQLHVQSTLEGVKRFSTQKCCSSNLIVKGGSQNRQPFGATLL